MSVLTPGTPTLESLIETYGTCRGKGRVQSTGNVKGNLDFEYTLSRDSLFILFRDYLGRRAIFIQVLPRGIASWNILEQRPLPLRQIAKDNPFMNLLTPDDLITIFWGIIPDVSYLSERKLSEAESVNLTFSTSESIVGRLIQSAVISTDHIQVELDFQSRELGQLNHTLARKIPGTIPWDK